ncbi:putative glutathione-specific gamma-glutamylcyclotransferase 2 [Schistocerca cancellata]|uniref:putative glutathione-specific gamma-glutamylcyclotransferase 2 n=1 Tax=Schistocerca cancellata TaxID=274614 RepID=UPI0021183F89|nr:putative glutathione-specific gamma-glutamylcyclotransferase 2 [Schistocerca cancellata]
MSSPESESESQTMWVFAYGAMLWKEDLPFLQKITGCITGYVRRFWVASDDYQCFPNKRGRVVALVRTGCPRDMVWGATYEIDKKNEASVASEPEFFGRAGFVKQTATFYPVLTKRAQFTSHVKPFDITLYVATDNNSCFKRNEPLNETASCIANAHGPNGSNAEYLYNLVAEMRLIAPNYKDHHLYPLESAVKKIIAEREASVDL